MRNFWKQFGLGALAGALTLALVMLASTEAHAATSLEIWTRIAWGWIALGGFAVIVCLVFTLRAPDHDD